MEIKTYKCPNCGSDIKLDHKNINSNSIKCPNCNIDLELENTSPQNGDKLKNKKSFSMKMIFCIVSAVFIAFIGVLLVVLSTKEKVLSFDFDKPYFINVYNKSSTTINNSSYSSSDKEYSKIIDYLEKSTKTSLLNLLLKTGSIKYNINYGEDNYSKYDTNMKKNNLVIELIYKEQKNVVVYEGKNTRVIAYSCLLFIIPCENKFEDIVVYNSYYNDSTLKETEYKDKVPFIIKGNPTQLISYVDSIS